MLRAARLRGRSEQIIAARTGKMGPVRIAAAGTESEISEGMSARTRIGREVGKGGKTGENEGEERATEVAQAGESEETGGERAEGVGGCQAVLEETAVE